MPEQVLVLFALVHGVFDDVPLNRMTEAEHQVRTKHSDLPKEILNRIYDSKNLNDEEKEVIISLAKEAIQNILDEEKLNSNG